MALGRQGVKVGRRTGRIWAWMTIVAAWSCHGAGPLAPIDPDGVAITLDVSGGFAGLSYAFGVDGSELELRGVRCRAFCDWDPGELILPLSAPQVADLARRLEEADVFRWQGDWGAECCDQIAYDLEYHRDGRSARVSGTSSRMPPRLAEAIGHLATLSYRQTPMLVAPETSLDDWPKDAYTLGGVDVAGTTMSAEVTYGGGCGLHRMDLVAWGGWMESSPVQVNALVTHDDGDDMCDALVTEARGFDLSPLARAYREAYGPSDGPTRVILRLWDPLSGSPIGRLIEVTF